MVHLIFVDVHGGSVPQIKIKWGTGRMPIFGKIQALPRNEVFVLGFTLTRSSEGDLGEGRETYPPES